MFYKEKNYPLFTDQHDPIVEIRLPSAILKALVLRSEENGQAITLEIIIRLARSLERDLAMLEQDNEIAYQAFTWRVE